MTRFPGIVALVCLCIAANATADQEPAAGKLLVATEEVRGDAFAQTVILLLYYDDTGAMGLVINRPTEATPREVLPELESLNQYRGTLYWGGPVHMATLRALLRSDTPPEDAIPIFDAVYRLPLADKLPPGATSAEHLRFFIGYAGWSPGQLDRELVLGSWDIVPATEEVVFAEDTGVLWEQLSPPRQYRASLTHESF